MSKDKYQEQILGVKKENLGENTFSALGDKAYQMGKYIDELKKYDDEVKSKTATKEKLEDDSDIMSKSPKILQGIAIVAANSVGLNVQDIPTLKTLINKWIDWSVTANKDADNKKIVGDAVWQVWLILSKEGVIKGTTIKKTSYPTFISFINMLLNSGLLNSTKVSYEWTDYDRELTKIDILDNEIEAAQLKYDDVYKKATDLKNKGGYGVSDAKLDLYDNRKARKERHAKRKKARKERHAARKEVNSIIWNLEKKDNPKERDIVASYEKGLISMEAITKRNQESEKAKFIEVGKLVETKEVELANIHTIINAKEKRLAELGDLYDFAERKEARYKRKDARKDYTNKKKALKEQYKSEYGKGWKKEVGWSDIKTDLLTIKQDVINEYAGFGTKAIKVIKAGVLYQAPLSGFHLLLVSNAFDIAGRMLRTKQNDELAWSRIKTIYQKFGGDKANLMKIVEKHGRQKPLPRYGDAIGKLVYKKGEPITKIKADGDYFINATGFDDAAIVAAITAATPIVVQVIKAIDKGDNVTGNPSTDAEIKENEKIAALEIINNSELSEAQKKLASEKISLGVSIQDAIEQVGGVVDDGTSSKSYWIIGTAAALILGVGAYLLFRKK